MGTFSFHTRKLKHWVILFLTRQIYNALRIAVYSLKNFAMITSDQIGIDACNQIVQTVPLLFFM